ncbi:MAG: hypothetical protein LBF02_00415 [Mycoplasmataceae bacterium]|nr:hypothetical protein [Mycoplasmataceae bacterium]
MDKKKYKKDFKTIKECIKTSSLPNTISLKNEYLNSIYDIKEGLTIRQKCITGSYFYKIIKENNESEQFSIWSKIVFGNLLPETKTSNSITGQIYEELIIKNKYGNDLELQKKVTDKEGYFKGDIDAYKKNKLIEIKTVSLDRLFYIEENDWKKEIFFNPFDNLPVIKKKEGKYNDLFDVKQNTKTNERKIRLLYKYEKGMKRRNINEIIEYIFTEVEEKHFYKVEKIIENIYQVLFYLYILEQNNEKAGAEICYIFLPKDLYINDEKNKNIYIEKFNRTFDKLRCETIHFSYEEIKDNKYLRFGECLQIAREWVEKHIRTGQSPKMTLDDKVFMEKIISEIKK